ncbi:MAG TPA: hypothetical protein VNF99_07050 [Stellaceae bacterium]|nr:hypothetical protein [Stellaceae bacterium]
MRRYLLAALLLAPLGACAGNSGNAAGTAPTGTDTAVAAAETPLLMAFRVPVCIARTAVLFPVAIASAIVPFSKSKEGSGVEYWTTNAKADCGPPYVVTPAQVSTEP